jgi:hypothetical protein
VPSRHVARTCDRRACDASREHELHFPSEKNAFLFSRGKISASSRRVDHARRQRRRVDPADATGKLFLQNS